MSITYEQAQMIIEGKWAELARTMPDFDKPKNWSGRSRDELPLVADFSVIVNFSRCKPDRTLNNGFSVWNSKDMSNIYTASDSSDKGFWYKEVTFDIINGMPYLVLHCDDESLICWKIEE